MEDSAVQVPAATSGRIFGDAAVWIEALPLCARCWLCFQEKVGQELGELALEQPNGLVQDIAHLWFIFVTFKMSQMTCKPLSYRQEDMRFAAPALLGSSLCFPSPGPSIPIRFGPRGHTHQRSGG